MLNTEQREELRQLIVEEIRSLEESIESLRQRIETVEPDVAIGRLSRLDSMMNRGTVEMAMADASKKLQRLRGKLERIDDPDFGKCAMCGEWISMERLRAAPDRGVCLACLRKQK